MDKQNVEETTMSRSLGRQFVDLSNDSQTSFLCVSYDALYPVRRPVVVKEHERVDK